IDAGCIHVRPALDLTQNQDQQLVQRLSEDIFNLVKSYNGVFWGEHGKGYRSCFTPKVVGETLYQCFRQIKGVCDPHNKLNPGKIAAPPNCSEPLVSVDGPFKGQFDGNIPLQTRQSFETAFSCNGNGACFTYQPEDVMCPSYKATKDRIHSPKGRAQLIREWLRLKSNNKLKDSFSHEVF
ncbi:MAG: glycerol-3-phosphate dehydrogenase, partial [Candidatus Margulisbacteria bacterium]|nr:glycerol-3-phosphate dehydrogenase [Candidatus Margulisiibacteriota bacterium]